MKSDTMGLILVAVTGLTVTAAVLEVRDANMLAESYRESAYRSLEMAEGCAARLEEHNQYHALETHRLQPSI